MSIWSTVYLGALRLQAQQRADMENSSFISTPEWNQYISQSYKALYDKLVSAYGNDYYVASLFQFTVGSSQYYPLPDGTLTTIGGSSVAPPFYKLIGVDLQYSASPTGWVSLRRFEEAERNKYSLPNTSVNYLGYTNLKYRISGSNIEFIPIPIANQIVQLKYVPQPTPLQFIPICSTTNSSQTVGIDSANIGNLSVGMNVYGSGIQTGTTISSINTNALTIQVSLAATATSSAVPLYCWTDAASLDGVAGWEEFIVIDAAMKALVKEESDISALAIQREEITRRIESMAEGRDIGQAHHVQDVLSMNGYGMQDADDWGSTLGGW